MSRPTNHRTRLPQRAAAWLAYSAGAVLFLAGTAARAAIDCAVATPGVAFGNYDASLPGPTDVSGNLTVTCTRVPFDPFNVSYTLSLSRGTSGAYAPRQMSSGPSRLNYNLYRDASRSQVWGDGTTSTAIINATMSFNLFQFSKSASHTAYGRIPTGQGVNPGNYADNVVVTITF
jgi:spore coat protein U-like protein